MKLEKLFSGKKDVWRATGEEIIAKVSKFGPDIVISVGETYVNIMREKKKFAILRPSSAERLDIGIKLKGLQPEGRFEDAGSWNSMVTHRVRVCNPKEIDAEVLSWLRNAYEAAVPNLRDR